MSLRQMQGVNLARLDQGGLVTRPQARRIAQCFQTAATVELDFAGITEIGQAFADEMFRVFAQAQPLIRITPLEQVLDETLAEQEGEFGVADVLARELAGDRPACARQFAATLA